MRLAGAPFLTIPREDHIRTMAWYIVKRLLYMIPTLFAISVVAFVIMTMIMAVVMIFVVTVLLGTLLAVCMRMVRAMMRIVVSTL